MHTKICFFSDFEILIFYPVLAAFTMFFMPETPYYLITKNKEQEAKKSLQWLRGMENVNNELDELKRAYSEQKKVGKVSYLSLITNKVYFKPFLIMNALMFIQQFSGVNAVMFYLKVPMSQGYINWYNLIDRPCGSYPFCEIIRMMSGVLSTNLN